MDRKAAEVLATIGIRKEADDEGEDIPEPLQAPPTSSSASSSAAAIAPPPKKPVREAPVDTPARGGGKAASKQGKGAGKRQPARWWEGIDSTIVCPISLAPVCELPS